MRQTFRKILQLLDGQPTIKRGQSMVEMALTAPILVVMVLGLVEVGFLANDYMILLDAVRSAGRAAVNLDPTTFPVGDPAALTTQRDGARNQQRMDCDTYYDFQTLVPGTAYTTAYGVRQHYTVPQYLQDGSNNPAWNAATPLKDKPRGSTPGPNLTAAPFNYYYGLEGSFGFFDEVACQVTINLQSIIYNDNDAVSQDDIVVSSISYSKMKFKDSSGTMIYGAAGPSYAAGPGTKADSWVRVTGRYPIENRFCGFNNGGTGWASGDNRDPFDYMTADLISGWTTGTADPAGLTGDYNASASPKPLYEGILYKRDGTLDTSSTPGHYILSLSQAVQIPPGSATNHNQGVRGFVFSGHHKNVVPVGSAAADDCYGSAFRVQDIEEKLNLDATWNPSVPNGGLVIVEVFWQYHPFFFGPLFQGFTGNRANDPMLHVWGWFPVPAAEPTETP